MPLDCDWCGMDCDGPYLIVPNQAATDTLPDDLTVCRDCVHVVPACHRCGGSGTVRGTNGAGTAYGHRCAPCNGTGLDVRCTLCAGSGQISVAYRDAMTERTTDLAGRCPRCHGNGVDDHTRQV